MTVHDEAQKLISDPSFNWEDVDVLVPEMLKEWYNIYWHPVSEKPPEEDKYYWVLVRDGYGDIYEDEEYYGVVGWSSINDEKVVAWRNKMLYPEWVKKEK